LREQEVPPPRHKLVELEDVKDDDVLETKKSKKTPDGIKMKKDKIRRGRNIVSQDRYYGEVQRIVGDEDFEGKRRR
jgi:hypothetical protein